MKKAGLTFIATVLVGVMAVVVGAIMQLEGYIGNVFAIATAGAFIVSAIEEKRTK